MLIEDGQKEVKQEVVNPEPKEIVSEEITPEMIVAWKKQHGKIFKSIVGSESFVWRKLKRKEYTEIMSIDEADESSQEDRIYKRQMDIAKAITIWPLNIAELLEDSAGLATTLSDEAILKSGFNLMSTQEL